MIVVASSPIFISVFVNIKIIIILSNTDDVWFFEFQLQIGSLDVTTRVFVIDTNNFKGKSIKLQNTF